MEHAFFKMVSAAEFVRLLQSFPQLGNEHVPLEECHGRVLAAPFIAPENLPLVDRSCMDGYAVRAADLFGASESSPAYLDVTAQLPINIMPDITVTPGTCTGITTGGSLPQGANAVVMVEHTQDLGAGAIEVAKPVAPGENVMLKGEDARQGDEMLAAGRVLRTQEVGLLSALGHTTVNVFSRPRVGILSTGDELIPVDHAPRPGQVRDVNSNALSCQVRDAGGVPKQYGLLEDDLATITSALRTALTENDVVLISGGSSVGMRDLTIQAIESLPDSEVLVHGVAVSPGKPTILAKAGEKTIFGLPGQVTSAQVVMLVFGMPFLRHLGGNAAAFDPHRRPTRQAILASNLASKQGREDYVRVRLEPQEDGSSLAKPRTGKSGLLKTLVQANGLVWLDAGLEGIEAGANIDVWLI